MASPPDQVAQTYERGIMHRFLTATLATATLMFLVPHGRAQIVTQGVRMKAVHPYQCVANNTWHVPDNFPTIQAALGSPLVVDGDRVIVRPGVYVENIDYLGKGITLTSEQGPHVTTIDGAAMGSVVSFTRGEGRCSVLRGFTITNGNAALGGGIYCSGSSPRIENNTITGNYSTSEGGGVSCRAYSSPVIVNNDITMNTAIGPMFYGSGGGIHAFDHSDPLIFDNRISQNHVNYRGAGICIDAWSNPLVSNNLIVSNTADQRGAGICCQTSVHPVLVNNTITLNSALVQGGAIDCYDDANPVILNTICWGDAAPSGPELSLSPYGGSYSTLTASFSNVMGGQGGVALGFGCSVSWGPGMLDADPLFAASGGQDFFLSQFPLQATTSPCVDTGDPTLPAIDGTTRTDHGPDLGVSDMGYHYH